ncbi:MAG: 2-C-methyl-D-erythritol 4-phosphate cytidylyltransferase [Cyclobacteriaceae bacterium]
MIKYAILVAGGKGERMDSNIPKQFLSLAGWPILMHTIAAFRKSDPELHIIVVLPSGQIESWNNLVVEYAFKIPHEVVTGGKTRFNSVQNGLKTIKGDGLVAIHDGVRPLVNAEVINNSYLSAAKHGSAVASVVLKESIRKIEGEKNTALNRNDFRLMQTPQTFQVALIKQAFQHAKSSDFTDDASVLENYGEKIHLIEGSYQNLKITTKEDLIFAESVLGN